MGPNAVMAAPVSMVTLPPLRPAEVLESLTVPPIAWIPVVVSVPFVVMLTWPPALPVPPPPSPSVYIWPRVVFLAVEAVA